MKKIQLVADILIVIMLKNTPKCSGCCFGSLSLLSCVFLMDQTEKLFKPAAVPNDIQHRQTHLANMVKHLAAYRPKCSPQELVETRTYNKSHVFWAAGWETTVFLLPLTLLAPKTVQENQFLQMRTSVISLSMRKCSNIGFRSHSVLLMSILRYRNFSQLQSERLFQIQSRKCIICNIRIIICVF